LSTGIKSKAKTLNNQKNILARITAALPTGLPCQVCIGLHWTAVVMDVCGELRCGLASTLKEEHKHGVPAVPQAGTLENLTGLALANLTQAEQPLLVSVGMAAVNALLPRQPCSWVDLNAEDVIGEHGVGKPVALIGHFPFIERLREKVGKLSVLELNPQPGDLPVSATGDVLKEAKVVAITGMTLLNHTLDELLRLCAPDALVILMGPSVPLDPILFENGVDILCGSIVTSIDGVLAAVRQGATFRQVHRAGVRLVTVTRPGLAL
jgi:uncharacterized protein (DUF4213/DUF364 family)